MHITESVCLERCEPTFYARIPAILYKMTYQKGGKAHRLSPHAVALYGYLKQLAGPGSHCWATRVHYASAINVSTGLITKLKSELSQPMDHLDGKPLIKITKKKRHTRRDDGTHVVSIYDHITITDIWAYNDFHMSKHTKCVQKPVGIVHELEPRSDSDYPPPPRSVFDESVSLGARSVFDANNSNSQESSCKITDSAPCPSPSSDSAPAGCNFTEVLAAKEGELRKRTGLEKSEPTQDQAKQRLEKVGCDERFISEMLKRFPPERIMAGIDYVWHQGKRGKVTQNRFGYLRRAIEQGLVWEESPQKDPKRGRR